MGPLTTLKSKLALAGSCLAFTALSCCNQPASHSQTNASALMPNDFKIDTATFANGCFWCTEAIFQQLDGVLKVTSGYSGGHIVNPTYEQVCDKKTGHAEAIQILYNPDEISYDDLLEVFWRTHDPTSLNRQGNDVGPQYRSAVFYHNQNQQQKALHYKNELIKEAVFSAPIVTEITAFTNFYPAENYHQNFYRDNPANGYCAFVIRPKLEKFEKVFATKLRKNRGQGEKNP